MYTRDLSAQLDTDFRHVHKLDLKAGWKVVGVTNDRGTYQATYYRAYCGAWLPDFCFAYGDIDCGCCLAVDHLLSTSST